MGDLPGRGPERSCPLLRVFRLSERTVPTQSEIFPVFLEKDLFFRGEKNLYGKKRGETILEFFWKI